MTATGRRLLADFLVYGAGDFFVKLLALLTLPVYTRTFSPDDYGLWSYIFTATVLLGDTLSLGGASAYSRLYFDVSDEESRCRLTSTWLAALSGWLLVTTLVALPLARPASTWSFGTDAHRDVIRAALLMIPLRTLNLALGQVLRNQMRPVAFSVLNIASSALEIGFAIVAVVGLQSGVIGIPLGMAAAGLIILPIRIWTVRGLLARRFSRPVLREMLLIGVPLVPSTMSFWILSVSDRVMLGKLSTLEQVGLFSVANYLVSAMAMLYAALGQAWSPHMLRIHQEDPQGAPQIVGQMATYVLVLFGFAAVGAAAFGPELLRFLTSPAYYGAAAAIGPLALGVMAYASTQVTASGIGLFKRTGLLSLHSWTAATLNVGLNYLLIPRFGMIAAAWTTAASFLYLTLGCLVSGQKLWAVKFETRRVATVVASTIAFTLARPWFSPQSLAGAVALDAALVVGYVAVLFATGGLSHRDIDRLKRIVACRPKTQAGSRTERQAA